tara:strand:+ start:193 stop:351 length:159 start_codon:yes stop_codon:yes gene_type:complete
MAPPTSRQEYFSAGYDGRKASKADLSRARAPIRNMQAAAIENWRRESQHISR